jgi:hypothetical protein
MALNFMRSANAPVMSAGVMIAKVIWKIMNTVSGMTPEIDPTVTFLTRMLLKLPMMALPSVKAML